MDNNLYRIRLLILTSVFESLGGSEKNILDLVRHLPSDTFEKYVLALKGGPLLQEIKRLGVHAEEVGLHSIVSLTGIMKGFNFFRFLREKKIDILLTYHEDADLWGGLIGRLANVPVIISNKRDMGYQVNTKQRLVYRVLNDSFTRVVAVSSAVKDEIARTQKLSESKFEIIYNGISMNAILTMNKSYYLHDLLKIPHHHQLVGMVASFRPVKGQEFFVQAAANVLHHYQNIDFVIIGNNETKYYSKVSKLIKELGIESHIYCIGSRNDIPEILPSLDIFVLSSVHEGFSNAILEAMAAGLPVIASNSGGNPEIVNPETGILFNQGDVDMLSKAILCLLEKDKERLEMGLRGKELVRSKFPLKGMIHKYEELFLSELKKV